MSAFSFGSGEDMGESSTVYVVSDVPDDAIAFWQEGFGYVQPDALAPGRLPTLNELREILDGLEGFEIRWTRSEDRTQADIERPGSSLWACLIASPATENAAPEAPHDFYFSRGSRETNIDIVCRIADRCGGLILQPDSGEWIAVCMPGANPRVLPALEPGV